MPLNGYFWSKGFQHKYINVPSVPLNIETKIIKIAKTIYVFLQISYIYTYIFCYMYVLYLYIVF